MTGTAREPADLGAAGQPAAAGAARHATGDAIAEVDALTAAVAERTADLQRVTAEYANYRKRVDRDRAAVVEGATGAVLATLLPVLDDIDRARAHGDLTGTFKAVADQLETTLEKLGLAAFGEPGDPFDPMLHEAVMHATSPEVSAPTCVGVLRRGYRYGERLLRAPLVAVADPEPAIDADAAAEPVSPTDLLGDESTDWFAGEGVDDGATGEAAGAAGAAGDATVGDEPRR